MPALSASFIIPTSYRNAKHLLSACARRSTSIATARSSAKRRRPAAQGEGGPSRGGHQGQQVGEVHAQASGYVQQQAGKFLAHQPRLGCRITATRQVEHLALTPQQFGTWLSTARAQLYLGLNQWTPCFSPLAPPPLWLQPLTVPCLTPPTPISISGPPSPLLVHLPPASLSLQLPFKTSFSSRTHLFLPQSPLFRGLFLRASVSQGFPLLTASWLHVSLPAPGSPILSLQASHRLRACCLHLISGH